MRVPDGAARGAEGGAARYGRGGLPGGKPPLREIGAAGYDRGYGDAAAGRAKVPGRPPRSPAARGPGDAVEYLRSGPARVRPHRSRRCASGTGAAILVLRHAPPLVRHGDRDVHPVDDRAVDDGRRRGRLPGRVREQAVSDLDNALPVGGHPPQVLRQVEADGVPSASIEERAPRLLDQPHQLHRLGRNRPRADLCALRRAHRR